MNLFNSNNKERGQILDVLNERGIMLGKSGRYEEAITVFDSILEIEPTRPNTLNNKALSLVGLGRDEEALALLQIVDPNFVGLKVIQNSTTRITGEEATSALQSATIETYLFFDTETTGLPRNWSAPVSDLANWPRLVQIAWVLYKDDIKVSSSDFIIKPEGFRIPADASAINHITTERAEREGVPLQTVLNEFQNLVEQADFVVAHNISFDEKVIGAEFLRKNMPNSLIAKKTICTKEQSTNFCAIPSTNGYNDYKWPKLSELHMKLFGTEYEDSHNAVADVNATARCFWELKKRGIL